MGRALYSAIQQSRVNDKFQEPLYLSLELSRAGVLHGDAWSGRQYSGGPSFGTRQLWGSHAGGGLTLTLSDRQPRSGGAHCSS